MLKNFLITIFIFVFLGQTVLAHEPYVSGKSAVVIEAGTGEIIYQKNAHAPLPMASTTKIMTAICAIENTNTNFPIKVSDTAVGIEGSSIYLQKGEVITIKELLYGLMLNSGNDAAVALAIAVSGSVEDFCNLMNQTAKAIGAKNTNFTNPSGLYDDNHYTTAYDLAIISAYALKNPLFKEIVSSKEKKISAPEQKSRYLKNHNKLLWNYSGAIGVKTGYTKKCGRCLVSAATREGVTLVAVTLNAPDDWSDHTKMLDFGFSKAQVSTVFKKGDYATAIEVNGVQVPLYFDKSLKVLSKKTEDILVEYDFKNNASLPVFSGEALGRVRLVYNGKTFDGTDLCCQKNVLKLKKPSFGNVFFNLINHFIC